MERERERDRETERERECERDMKRLALALFTTLSKFIKTFKGSKNEQECAQDFETGVALFRECYI